MIRGLEHHLRETRLFSLEKSGLQEDLIAAFQYLKDDYRKEGLFMRACGDRTGGNGFKLRENQFRLDFREKKCFILSAVRHWHRLPREAVTVLSQKYLRPVWMGL